MRRLVIAIVGFSLMLGVMRLETAAATGLHQDDPPAEEPTSTPTATEEPTQIPFTLSSIEPGELSNVTGGALSIYGSGFQPGIVVRLVGYGLLDTVLTNNAALKAAVPPGVPAGSYDVEVIQVDGGVLRMVSGVRIEGPSAPTPTPTPTPGRLVVYGQPQLIIASSQIEPAVIGPGSAFTLKLSLTNRGDYTATKIKVSLGSVDLAVPTDGSSLRVIDLLAQNETSELEFSLALSDNASPGYHNLEIVLEYSDYIGRSFSSPQSVGINIGSSHAEQPLVILESYTTDPETLSPGNAFTLHLEVNNVGESSAYQLLVTLGGQDGMGVQPFALLDSGNVKFYPALSANNSLQIEQRFIVDGSAASGVYNLPVTLEYETADGKPITANQMLNLLVNRLPQLKIGFYRPVEKQLVGETVTLPVEVINIGRHVVTVSTMEVTGQDMQIAGGISFIGALDGGTTGSMDASAVPEKSGRLPVLVTVNYLDDFNQPQTITAELAIEVEEPTPVPTGFESGAVDSEEAATGWWARLLQILKGLVGLGS